jgi:hypothetical protein
MLLGVFDWLRGLVGDLRVGVCKREGWIFVLIMCVFVVVVLEEDCGS